MASQECSVPCIDVEIAIGFNGSIPRGLQCHPDGYHLVYAVGNMVVIEHTETRAQVFLQDICSESCNYHKTKITCLDVSITGKYIAAGTQNESLSSASVVVWCYETRCIHFSYEIHRVRVESLAFTCDEGCLLSLGGPDDRCVAITDVVNKKPQCSAVAQKATSGNATCVTAANTSSCVFVTAGRNTLRVWDVDPESHRLKPTEILLGKSVRNMTCLAICLTDEFGYAGTTSGDVVVFNLQKRTFVTVSTTKCPIQFSITQLALNPGSGEMLLGSGTGLLAVFNRCMARTMKEMCLEGRITSIVPRGCSTLQYYVGTDAGNIYRMDLINACIKKTLLKTAHTSSVNDLAMPCGTSDLLVSGSNGEVRIWSLRDHWELLRLVVDNRECLAVCVTKDGRSIVTGWNDSQVRAYYPESGRPMYIINSCYGTRVTALSATDDSRRIITGSDLGHVVVWNVPERLENKCRLYVFEHVLLKEHRAPVTDIKVRTVQKCCEDSESTVDVDEILSCSMDGTLIVWSVRKGLAVVSIKTHYTMFKSVAFDPVCPSQAVATGTGGKITCWELCRGLQIFQCDDAGSKCDINGLDVDCPGEYLVTGDDDRIVKVWRRGDMRAICRGYCHSHPVNRVLFAPNRCRIVSASSDGTIFVWRFCIAPHPSQEEVCQAPTDRPQQPAVAETGQGDVCADEHAKTEDCRADQSKADDCKIEQSKTDDCK